MRRMLPLSCLTIALCITNFSFAQNDRFAYAITDLTKDKTGWNALRKLDLQTGEYSTVLLNGIDLQLPVFDAVSKKTLSLSTDAKFGDQLKTPFGTGVAAAAYDKKNHRLYYTPMFVDQLRYIDLKTMKLYYVSGQKFSNAGDMHNDPGKIITRMVIAPDGNGYAISSDGNSFIKFTTGKKTEITQLGALVDDPSNDAVSVHNSCSSYGGDMIADDDGNLIIITARNYVFTVNTETRIAKSLGMIKGLSPSFTVNGAVVDADGSLLVSSAVDASSYYVVNPKDWTATVYKSPTGIFPSSDLANSNFLASRSRINNPTTVIETVKKPFSPVSSLVQVYPNPVTADNFVIQFSKLPSGDYTMELMDVAGRRVMQKRVNIQNEEQTLPVTLSRGYARGMYMIKLTNKNNKAVHEQKLMVQ